MMLVGLGGPSVEYLEVSQGHSCSVHPKESKAIAELSGMSLLDSAALPAPARGQDSHTSGFSVAARTIADLLIVFIGCELLILLRPPQRVESQLCHCAWPSLTVLRAVSVVSELRAKHLQTQHVAKQKSLPCLGQDALHSSRRGQPSAAAGESFIGLL